MVRTASCFAQVLSLVNRYEFGRLVQEHEAEWRSKGFSCWDQFVAMLFSQMAAADSLREICYGLETSLGKLTHLGMKGAPRRSTLAYANEHRPWQLYRSVFGHVLGRCQTLAQSKGRKFRFKNPLRSLDATVIELCLEMFDWARFRRAKGAIKLHLQLDHRGYLPCWALITDGKTHEVTVARRLSFDPGTIVAMDKAYTDFRMFAAWTEAGVFFVTRMKDNAIYCVKERRGDSEGGSILRDEIICLTGARAADKCPHTLRRVVAWDAEKEREIVLLTNIFHLSARTIAGIYKERWQIELFFKALKQNLKIKTFVGTSENAVQIQIWTALIAILLLKFMQLKSSWGWSLSNLAAMVRMNILAYRDLWLWLDDPFPPADQLPEQTQLLLWS
jgi:hypothetical protein